MGTKWECHNCGELHDQLPERCRSCGTAPEIVENVWRCASCGESGIGGTRSTCPSCGAEKGKDAAVAIAVDRKLVGPRALALAAGAWRYCAYCKTQIPPVNEQGKAIELCPTCGGPLSESKEQAASETVAAADAATYRPAKIEPVASAQPATSAAPPLPVAPSPPLQAKSSLKLYILGALALLLGLCTYVALKPLPIERFEVAGHSWEVRIDVMELGSQTDDDWASSLPAAAYDKQCERRVRKQIQVEDGSETYSAEVEDRSRCLRQATKTERIADGEESYTEQEQIGKSCARFEYETNGGVSIKKCAEWQPTYKEVTRTRTRYREVEKPTDECARYAIKTEQRTRPRYRKEPVYEDHCRYTVDTEWKKHGELRYSGDTLPIRLPEGPPELSPRQRLGERHERCAFSLRRPPASPKADEPIEPIEEACTEAAWQRFPRGSRVRGGVIGKWVHEVVLEAAAPTAEHESREHESRDLKAANIEIR